MNREPVASSAAAPALSGTAPPAATDTGMMLRALDHLARPLTAVRLCLELAEKPAYAERSYELLAEALQATQQAQQVLLLLRETLECSLPQEEAEAVELGELVHGVVRATNAAQRFSLLGRGAVYASAPAGPLRVSVACLLTTCLHFAPAETATEINFESEVERVVLRASFLASSVASPDFELLNAHAEAGTLAIARALAQGCGGELTMSCGNHITSLFLSLPLAKQGGGTVQ